jgi:hypothetical protein
MRKITAATISSVLAWNVFPSAAADIRAVPLKAGDVYSVQSTETLRGHIDFKKPGENELKKLSYNGERKSRYLERILESKTADDAIPERVLRVIETLESQRKIGDQPLEKGFPLRDESRHVVLHRGEAFSKPFSLKGPLKQDEIHTLSHQVFVPALNGLLPTEPLTVGLKWNANRRAVAQLAGLVPLETGDLTCNVKSLNFNYRGKPLVQIGFSGILKGFSEEGSASDDVLGALYLDPADGKIHSLTVDGLRTLYDENKKEAGRLEMHYELAIRPRQADPGLDDATAGEAAKDPTSTQTAVLYEYPPCAVKLVHPRPWILNNASGTKLEFEYRKEGQQLMMNFHEDDKTPTVQDYYKDVEANLKREKFTNIVWTIAPEERTKADMRLGWFEATGKKDGEWRLYYMLYQKGRRGLTMGMYLHSKAAQEGTLKADVQAILNRLEFTHDRNPFFVKPKAPEKK